MICCVLVVQEEEIDEFSSVPEPVVCQEAKPATEEYCLSRPLLMQMGLGMGLSLACLAGIIIVLFLRSRKKTKNEAEAPVLTYHFDNISCSGESTLSRTSRRTDRSSETNFQF